MAGVHIRERRRSDTYRRQCEKGGRDLSDIATSQEMPGVTRSSKRKGTDSQSLWSEQVY